MTLELYNPFEHLEKIKETNPELYKAEKKKVDEVMPKVAEGMGKIIKLLIEDELRREEEKKKSPYYGKTMEELMGDYEEDE